MLPAATGGVKAGVANGVLTFGEGMPEDAGDELAGGEGEVLAFGVVVVEVGEGDGGGVQVKAAIAAEGAALGVAGEVEGDAAAVGVWGVDLEVPVGAPLVSDVGEPVGAVVLGRQEQELMLEGVGDGAEEPAAKELAQGFEGQEEGAARGAPLTAGIEPAGGDQAVQVGVVTEVAAPGVQGHEQAGQGAEVVGIGAQVEQAGAGGIEEQPGHERAVELPQAEEAVRQGEDDVEVGVGQQLGQLSGEPALARRLGAARAAAVAAGVVLHGREVALRAGEHVHAHGGLKAVTDAEGSALLTRVQHMGLCVLGKVLPEHVLQGRAHGPE